VREPSTFDVQPAQSASLIDAFDAAGERCIYRCMHANGRAVGCVKPAMVRGLCDQHADLVAREELQGQKGCP